MYYMHYNKELHSSPVHDFYIKYDVPYVFEIENNSANTLIFRETFCTYLWDSKCDKVQKIVWWLSVTNFFLSLK